MGIINQRPELDSADPIANPIKRRNHVLVAFPDESLEAVVIQWSVAPPSVFIQPKQETHEPLPADQLLNDFVDPATGKIFGELARKSDILISRRAFEMLQPEPDSVLPVEMLWECRAEALRALGIPDAPL